MNPESVHRKVRHDGDDGRCVAKAAFVFGHGSAREGMRADDRVGALAQDQRPQIIGGKLVRPGAKSSDLGGSLGAIVDVSVHLGNGLDHPQIAVGDDAGDDQRGILVGIHDSGFCRRVASPKLVSDRICRRDVADTDAGGKE